jgi:hypothetical protein
MAALALPPAEEALPQALGLEARLVEALPPPDAQAVSDPNECSHAHYRRDCNAGCDGNAIIFTFSNAVTHTHAIPHPFSDAIVHAFTVSNAISVTITRSDRLANAESQSDPRPDA